LANITYKSNYEVWRIFISQTATLRTTI
jgi:hypothetical protein